MSAVGPVNATKGPKPYTVRNYPPNQTIYVNNLADTISKKILKKKLYDLFVRYGKILDIKMFPRQKGRGQAFIVFTTVAEATESLILNQFRLFDKPLCVSFARMKSDAVDIMEGRVIVPGERMREEAKSIAAFGFKADKPSKSTAPSVPDLPPHKILFLENLPESANTAMAGVLFQHFAGFLEVRMVPGRPGLAFVEFDTEPHATVAKKALQNFKVTPAHKLRITYSKKEEAPQ